MPDMRRFATYDLHRWTRWVLVAWLCVALAGVLSPLARAQASAAGVYGPEPVCSAIGSVHRVASPAAGLLADTESMPVHGLDCPLCMPLLAPPPPQSLGVVASLSPGYTGHAAWRAPHVRNAAAPLPARGPPQI